ncbi:hypothetical protein Cgig2_018581 [Carnegiea gigantea]|uniref:Uncharacterized protein n=1 Tax=Carnegiea gigantea TaxID=171969 RepID=A0A9Q1KL58_9CARY|nr:hypothetical protein Cgig2_018581 [Carnegiea gigantea]
MEKEPLPAKPAEKRSKKTKVGKGKCEEAEKTSSLGQDIQMAPQQQPLKYEKNGNEKRMYQKAFITRMSIHSFSPMMARLNEAQTKAVISIGFASFLKVDLKQILGKFSKWLIDSFDSYSASFVLLDGQRFMVTTFDAYVTLGVPIGGREIMESSRSSTDEEYDKVHAAWVKE